MSKVDFCQNVLASIKTDSDIAFTKLQVQRLQKLLKIIDTLGLWGMVTELKIDMKLSSINTDIERIVNDILAHNN